MAPTTVIHAFAKLIAVRVLVTIAAVYGGLREVDVLDRHFQVGWLVAIRTAHRSMRSDQREARLRMIKLRQVFPLLRRMARFAAQGTAGGIMYRHPLCKLPMMDIFMARRAVELLEVI